MLWRRSLRDWLKRYSKDVPQRFEDEAEVSTVFKRSLQSDDMLFVIWIGLVKLIQHLYFLETRFVPKERNQGGADAREKTSAHRLLAPDNLNSDFPPNICRFPTNYPCAYHVGKHSFAKGGENLIAPAIELFT